MRSALSGVFLLCAGCAFVSPRFPQNIASSFAHQNMRKLETQSLEVYYPEKARDEAIRVADRVERCVEDLRRFPVSTRERPKVLLFLTSSDFNNAYVQPLALGDPEQMVLPLHASIEYFNLFELGASEVGDIACHESVHFIHFQQTEGLWEALNWFTGGLFQPNSLDESWFAEGLATFYEGRLERHVGRPHSTIWNGLFEAGIAARHGWLNPGDLSAESRDELPVGGNYLIGQHFVDYLARRWGEQRLWSFIDEQAHSWFSPLGLTLRFRSVYGETIGGAFDDWTADLQAHPPVRVRPPEQRVLQPDLGYWARIASAPDGAIAAVTAERDAPVKLTLFEPSGTTRFSRLLTPILPFRRWIEASPDLVSGMSFTADGKWLFLLSVDVDEDGSDISRIWKVDARNGNVVQLWNGLVGFGGSVSPDGAYYVYVAAEKDTNNLVRLDLATGAREVLTHYSGRQTLGPPAVAADGRIAFSVLGDAGFDLWLRDPSGALSQITHTGAFQYAPRWLDANHLIASGAYDERAQVELIDLSRGQVGRVSDAPFIALDPAPLPNGRVVFLNRDGWNWSLDSVPLPSTGGAALEPPPPAAVEPEPGQTPILADQPYSSTDHLLLPSLRVPFFIALPGPATNSAGQQTIAFNQLIGALSLKGSDRLDFHEYAANLTYYSFDDSVDVTVGYGNYLLAPWFTELALEYAIMDQARDLQATLTTTRTFWTTPVTFGFTALDRTNFEVSTFMPGTRIHLIGPSAAFSYFAADGTPYAGAQRALGLSGAVAWYGSALGSTFDLLDARAAVDGYLPLPFSKRHSFAVSLVGRDLANAPQGLLRVGGTPVGTVLGTANSQREDPYDIDPIQLPANVAFTEPLRGYEDYAIRATVAGIATARYRYPFIIDYGWASTLYLLPSLFLRQVEVEAFGAAALTDSPQGRWHRAAGGRVSLRTTLGQLLPITLYGQFAVRFDDGLGPFFIAGFAYE